jgi:CBS domain-containing protein
MYEFLEYRVCDVMTADPVRLGADASLADAVRLFDEHDFNALPIIADDGTLRGVVTKLDVLGAFRFTDDEMFPAYDEIMKRPVVDATSADARTVSSRAHLTDVLEKMVETRAKSFPVVDGQQLVGVVAREDVLRGLRRASRGEAATGPI